MKGSPYELRVIFTASRELTEAERLALFGAVMAQVEDPAGIGESKRADYSTVTLSERLDKCLTVSHNRSELERGEQ